MAFFDCQSDGTDLNFKYITVGESGSFTLDVDCYAIVAWSNNFSSTSFILKKSDVTQNKDYTNTAICIYLTDYKKGDTFTFTCANSSTTTWNAYIGVFY